MALEYRLVDQNRDVKVIKRDVIWQHETRKPGASDYDPSRIIEVYGTDESVDRHNTKIMVDGWDLRDYAKNPTLLWLHNMDEATPKMPLGSVIAVEREEYARADAKEGDKTARRMLFRCEFPRMGTYKFADIACDMWKQGHLRASSVGFRNIEMRVLDRKRDKDEWEKEGFDANQGFAAILSKNSLMELSLVPVGSNPNALAKALREAAPEELRGIFDHPDIKDEELDERWLSARLAAFSLALAAPPEEDKGGEFGQGVDDAPEAEEVEEEDELSREIDAALAMEDLEEVNPADMGVAAPAPVVPAPDVKAFHDEIKAQLTELMNEVRGLRTEVQTMRGAAPSGGNTPPNADEPAPSPIDLLLDENIENLERLESLLTNRK